MKLLPKLAALALLSTINSPLSTALAQGSLTPPGAPAPTMKSLAQIEPRTAITNAGAVTISNSGSYYLTQNITVSTGSAVTIATNGVTLDLNGFTISSTAASATGTGILLNSGLRNITIVNGFIQGGVTNNGSGVYNGGGFANGIYYSGTKPANVLVSRVSVSGCLTHGIVLGGDDSTVVDNCTVRTIGSGGYGIYASLIKTSSAVDCGGWAIYGSQASDCRGESTGSSDGVTAATAQNCYGASASGRGVNATTAQNCYGSSTSGYGIFATGTAQNCRGSSSSGTGLYAAETAMNCSGYSATGKGLQTSVATGCRGQSGGSGNGVQTDTAENCRGLSSSGTGLYASNTVHTCCGISQSGTGLSVGTQWYFESAGSAENCVGTSDSGDGLKAWNVTNCRGLSRGGGTALYCVSALNSDGTSYSGTAIDAVANAMNCRGWAMVSAAIGLRAEIANSCQVYNGTTNITFKYNMP